jgi:hypothetical protein
VDFPQQSAPPILLATGDALFEGCDASLRNCKNFLFKLRVPLVPNAAACAGVYGTLPGADPARTPQNCFVAIDNNNFLFPNIRVPILPEGVQGPLVKVFNDVNLVFEFGAGQPFTFRTEPTYLQFSSDSRETFTTP